jgi:hypothetical protein
MLQNGAVVDEMIPSVAVLEREALAGADDPISGIGESRRNAASASRISRRETTRRATNALPPTSMYR